tara:strand:+ start:622 stop:915 length:294 start_codon:yes stop_codon:yes gene_type:complete
VLQKYLRVSKNKDEKLRHLSKLEGVINTPHWREIREEMEDSLLKEYMRIEDCNTIEEFIQVKSNIFALKRLAGLNGLVETVNGRRLRIRPPQGQNNK